MNKNNLEVNKTIQKVNNNINNNNYYYYYFIIFYNKKWTQTWCRICVFTHICIKETSLFDVYIYFSILLFYMIFFILK